MIPDRQRIQDDVADTVTVWLIKDQRNKSLFKASISMRTNDSWVGSESDLEGLSKTLGSGATFQIRTLNKTVRRWNLIYLYQRKCVTCNTEEMPLIFLILCLALNLVAMLPVKQNCTSVNGTCVMLTCFKENIVERINIHCYLWCLAKNTWP